MKITVKKLQVFYLLECLEKLHISPAHFCCTCVQSFLTILYLRLGSIYHSEKDKQATIKEKG